MTTIYLYDGDGVYAGPIEVDLNNPNQLQQIVLDSGLYTQDVPPEVPFGSVAKRTEGENPVWQVVQVLSAEEIASQQEAEATDLLAVRTEAVRSQITDLLNQTDWLGSRHRDQLDLAEPTSLTAEQYTQYLNWRSDLRALNDDPNWPDVTIPATPEFIGE